MGNKKWKVQVVKGWMLGVHSFVSKALALEFLDGWVEAEEKSGIVSPANNIKWLGKES